MEHFLLVLALAAAGEHALPLMSLWPEFITPLDQCLMTRDPGFDPSLLSQDAGQLRGMHAGDRAICLPLDPGAPAFARHHLW